MKIKHWRILVLKYFILQLETVLLFLLAPLQIHFNPYISSTHHLLIHLCICFQHQITILLDIYDYQVHQDFVYLINQYLYQQHFKVLLQLQMISLQILIFIKEPNKNWDLRILLIPYDLSINLLLLMLHQILPSHLQITNFNLHFGYLKNFFMRLKILLQ